MSHELTIAANPGSFTRVREVGEPLTKAAAEFAGFDSLVRENVRLLFKVAYGVLRNSHDAEDVVERPADLGPLTPPTRRGERCVP